jgi:thioredoxin-dependent peroxiredoxin
VAQLGRAPASGAGGRGFKSHQPEISDSTTTYFLSMTNELKIGDPAPDFHALAVGGKFGAGRDVSLADFQEKPLILYFYPKDDTPGCTTQACGLRDNWSEIGGQANIFGVSIDPSQSHNAFINKYRLPFPLLSDSDHKMVTAYGVWVEKNMYGKKYMGTERTTFVIDETGHISSILRKVKPEQHVEQLKAALSSKAKK